MRLIDSSQAPKGVTPEAVLCLPHAHAYTYATAHTCTTHMVHKTKIALSAFPVSCFWVGGLGNADDRSQHLRLTKRGLPAELHPSAD